MRHKSARHSLHCRGLLLAAALVLAASAPAKAARALRQAAASCADLVPGAVGEFDVEVRAGEAGIVASLQDAGPLYAVAAAQDADSPDGASQFKLAVREGSSNSQVSSATASSAGCATTGLVDQCASAGPSSLSVRLRCQNQERPCRVRVAVYVSACNGGPQPLVSPGTAAGGSGSGDGSGGGQQSPSPSPSPDAAAGAPSPPLPGSASPPPSSSSSGGGLSTTTWIIIGASVAGIVLLAVLIFVCCRRRCFRPAGDLEAGTWAPPKQQFVVSNGQPPPYGPQQPPQPQNRPPPTRPQQQPIVHEQQAQQPWRPQQPQQAVPHGMPAAGSGGEARNWMFAYKAACSRRTFATCADSIGRGGGVLQQHDSIDAWLSRLMAQQRWDGYLAYNDQPPEGFPKPKKFCICGHAKGVVLWNRQWVGYLLHSVPCWPQPLARGQLSCIEEPQTRKGQGFLWVLLPAAQLPLVLRQLQQMQVYVYAKSDSTVWRHERDEYDKWAVEAGFSRVQLGAGMWHMGKSNQPERDYYEELSRQFGRPWLLRSHTPQDQKVRSTPTVRNVLRWQPPGCDHAYLAGSEHAKLAVCESQPLVMVGDLNNAWPQHKRGGGGIVLRHQRLAALLRAAVVEAEAA